jgi:hypothetical protein
MGAKQSIDNQSGVDIPPELFTKKLFPKPTTIYAGEFCHENLEKCFKQVTPKYRETHPNVGFVAYKKTQNDEESEDYLTTVLVLPNTKVHTGKHYQNAQYSDIFDDFVKCRSDQAIVLNSQSLTNPTESVTKSHSLHTHDFIYENGKIVKPTETFYGMECYSKNLILGDSCWDITKDSTCQSGIHWFLRKSNAERYHR